jgi:hypothetical protein
MKRIKQFFAGHTPDEIMDAAFGLGCIWLLFFGLWVILKIFG